MKNKQTLHTETKAARFGKNPNSFTCAETAHGRAGVPGQAHSMEYLLSTLSHSINNPNNSILLDAETLEKVWKEVVPILDERYAKNGDFTLGGYRYSELRQDLMSMPKRIVRNSRRIKQFTHLLHQPD